ncbi:hypothetical protein D3C75_1185570 [compost metagenome]
MHVDAKRTAIDERNPQVNQVDQLGGQTALEQIAVNIAEGLVTFRRSAGVVDALSHDESSGLLFGGLHRGAAWPMLEEPCFG